MESDREKWFTVGELARRGGVTVRTLQYYDNCGLLTPSEYSEGGRRMYNRRDIIRLQQILFLKSMGFSLEEIRDKVLPAESAADLAHMFEQQKSVLVRQIAHIQQTVDQMDKIIEEVRLGQEAGIDRLLLIMRATRAGNPYFFMSRHMDREPMEYLFQRFDEKSAEAFSRSLRTLTDKLIELYQRREKPEGEEGQQLADQWWNMTLTMTNGDLSLIPKISAAVVDENNWPPGSEQLKEATLTFLRQAIFTYLKNHNIKLP